ncbi:MAG: NADH-quinone oxidoreductase subunit D [Actinomycetota bacterium]|nr:MAG: NADH-quinone oxidoreductase subunit D [Actinomycetota bacterium]
MNAVIRTYVKSADLHDSTRELLKLGCRFQMAYLRYDGSIPEVVYLVDRGPKLEFLELVVRAETELPSLSELVPLLSWYEREIMDLSEITFTGNPEPFPLVLMSGMTLSSFPFDPTSKEIMQLFGSSTPPQLPEILATQVQDLFWGPIRADVVETGEFHFAYIGEEILHYTPRLFYKHRGIEQNLQQQDPGSGLVLAERVSGVGTICHGLAYCLAVEDALGIEVPKRAQLLRIILAELERIYNNLHYFGMLSKTTTLKVGEAFGTLLEENAKQINAKFSGHRLLRNILSVGGLRRDLNAEILPPMLSVLRQEAIDYLESLAGTQSYLDRLMGTGPLPPGVAFDFGATGPVANASGIKRDLRVQHPYSLYDLLSLDIPTRTNGDALARAEVRGEALITAFDLIQQAVNLLEAGEVNVGSQTFTAEFADGLGWSEGPRGACIYAVRIRHGILERVKIKSASFSNWKVFPLTVHSSNMMDYAINEASFGLTIAGVDR